MPTFKDAKTLFESIEEGYVVSSKVEVAQLMEKFINMKYDGVGGVREYNMKMVNIYIRLSELKCPVVDNFLINHAPNSLPSKFDTLKTSYNTQEKD